MRIHFRYLLLAANWECKIIESRVSPKLPSHTAAVCVEQKEVGRESHVELRLREKRESERWAI